MLVRANKIDSIAVTGLNFAVGIAETAASDTNKINPVRQRIRSLSATGD